MRQYSYENFNVLISRIDDSQYLARVIDSPAGEAKVAFSLPFSTQEIEDSVTSFQPTRSLKLPQQQTSVLLDNKQIGGALYEHVFKGDVEDVLQRSLGRIEGKSGLRIRLYLSDVPELMNIPWEYLYDASIDKFLALSANTPIVRYLALEDSSDKPDINLPLNILVMISNPENQAELDVEKEWQQLQTALADLQAAGKVVIHRLETANLESLQAALREKPYHIFHFIGHGDFDRASGDGVLILESADGTGEAVSAKRMGILLQDEGSIRLAILNACKGSQTSHNNPFAGVGQTFMRQGIPAVIAMQYEVTDTTAILFSRELYGLLAQSYPVDTALTEVRKSIFTSSNTIEWGTPVLYLRADSGEIITQQALHQKVEKVIPAASPLENTPFMLVSPNYFDDEVKISKHRLDNAKLQSLFSAWMKERERQWPASITPALLISTLKPVYIANFVLHAVASANYRATLGKTNKEKVTCTACEGLGKFTTIASDTESIDCTECKGKGYKEREVIENWEEIVEEVDKTSNENFPSFNRGYALESFRPGINPEAALKQGFLEKASVQEAIINSVVESPVKSPDAFKQGVEQKLYKQVFDKAQRESNRKADQVKDFELFNFQNQIRESFTWLYPVYLGTYTFKDEKLTVLVDALAGKLDVQKPKVVRKAQRIKWFIIGAAVVVLAGLGIYIYKTWKQASGL